MKFLIAIIFSFSLCVSSYAQENWSIDYIHSNIRFEAGWQEFSIRTGEFKVFNGTMVTNSREDLSDATFEITVDANSVDVISDGLADQIKSADFLDVENHPNINYVSNKVTKTGDNTYTSNGKLTIHGVEKDQEVSIKVKGDRETEDGHMMGLEVTLIVDKAAYGLDWGSPKLGDNIKLVGHLLYQLETEEKE